MKRVVTIKDIALRMGISVRSVSQALSGGESTTKVSEVKRERILRVAAEMGYRANHAARALRTGRSGVIGVMAFGYEHPFVARRLGAVMGAVQDCGYRPLAHFAGGAAGGLGDALGAMLEARVEGIIAIQPVSFGAGVLEREVGRLAVPLVAVGGHWLSRVPCFLPDKRGDFRRLVLHMVNEGCRSLVLMLHKRTEYGSAVDKRHHDDAFILGFRAGLAAARRRGVAVRGRVRRVGASAGSSGDGDIHRLHAPGYHAMVKILERGERPDGVLFQGDVWAQGALRACMERGVVVPREIAIAGYDDDPGSSVGALPLTSVAQSHHEISRLAVARLVEWIQTGNAGGLEPITVPGRLVVRGSSRRAAVLFH